MQTSERYTQPLGQSLHNIDGSCEIFYHVGNCTHLYFGKDRLVFENPEEIIAGLKSLEPTKTSKQKWKQLESLANLTRVIFRWEGKGDNANVLAVFPDEPGTNDPFTMACYARLGQHNSIPNGYYLMTKPCNNPDDYHDLYHELTQLGYNLKVMKRMPSNALDNRRKELDRIRNS